MLQRAYWLAKIGDGTTENEQPFPEIFSIGRHVADRAPPHGPAWREVQKEQLNETTAPIGGRAELFGRSATGCANQLVIREAEKRMRNFACKTF